MRQIRFIPVILGVLLCGCNEDLISSSSHGTEAEKGEVVICLTSDSSDNQTGTKAGADTEIPVGDFSVEIFNSNAIRLFYSPKYSDITSPVSLNAGNYRLLAKYGDSLGVGFNHAFYIADKTFEVRPQTKEEVSAIAVLGNVKAKVNFGSGLTSQYDEYYAVVRHSVYDKKLTFAKTETRAGFIPGGSLIFEIYVNTEDGWKYYASPAVECNPRDFVTFKVDTGLMEGKFRLNILIDDSVETIDKEIILDSSLADTSEPKINLAGFTEDGTYTLEAGVPVNDPGIVSMSAFCSSDIASATLSVTSEYIEGSPVTMELVGLSDQDFNSLEQAGITAIVQGTLGAVDLAGLIKNLSLKSSYKGNETVSARISLSVTDSYDKSNFSEVSVKVAPAASLSVNEVDVWATKVTSIPVTMVGENSSDLVLQISTDGSSWSDVEVVAESGNKALSNLEPAKTYSLRIARNGLTASNIISFTTEAAAQVGNAGFEEWTSVSYHYTVIIFGGDYYMDWYQPEGGNTSGWWASNSISSMTSSITAGYHNFKCFPNVCWSSNYHSGAKSAQIMVVNISNGNSQLGTSDSWHVGSLWIGTADASGNVASEGHQFTSRPSAVQFYHEYAPYGSDTWSAEVSLLAADGTVIATGQTSSSASVSNWESITINLNYSITDRKAETIKMKFTASVSGSHSCDTGGGSVEVAGGTRELVKISSVLRVDDIYLVY
ncbi:MAG: DUF4493 domain-containing protein [Candidatus Cryptobacteroides sp.]